jgi:thiosulfate dehydrogenase
MGRFLLGIVFSLVLALICGLMWLHYGKPPIAVADPPLPEEGQIAHIALDARIKRELAPRPPIDANEPTFVAGAHVYAEKCAVCHGFHGRPAPIGLNMFPAAPQLWEKHPSSDVVGVSDDSPSETYWKVANGIRLSGMPDFKTQLTDNEMWEVSVLLANANKPLPPSALSILRGDPISAVPAPGPSPATGPAGIDR